MQQQQERPTRASHQKLSIAERSIGVLLIVLGGLGLCLGIKWSLVVFGGLDQGDLPFPLAGTVGMAEVFLGALAALFRLRRVARWLWNLAALSIVVFAGFFAYFNRTFLWWDFTVGLTVGGFLSIAAILVLLGRWIGTATEAETSVA